MATNRVLRVIAVTGLWIGLPACAMNGDGLSAMGQDVVLPAPTNLTVTVVSTTREDLSWTQPALPPGEVISKYIIYRGLSPGTETTFTSASPDSTTFAYGHLSPNTLYCWQVRNLNAENQLSDPSNEVCASTADAPIAQAPTNVVATAISSSRITVTWNPVPGAISYQVFRGIPPAAPSFLSAVLAPTTTFTSAGLTPSTTYAFEIRAVTPAGTSDPSTPLAIATTFSLGLEAYYKFDEKTGAVANDSSGFARNGTLTAGASFATDKPQVLDDASALSVSSDATASVTVPNAVPFNFTGPFSIATWVKIPVTADVRIAGMRATGCGGLGWELGQNATDQLYFAGKNATRSFGASAAAGTWTHVAATYDGTTLTTYVNGAQTTSAAFTVGNALRQPLTLGHVAGCAGGAVLLDELQIYSRVLSATEVARLGALPPAPQNLTVTVVSSTRMDLSWSPVPGTTKYLVFRGTAPGNEEFFTSSTPDSPTFVYGHLSPGTQYTWRVAAGVAPLFSDPSNEVVATTLPPPPAPGGVTATALSSSRVEIDWGAVPNAVAYHVFQSTSGGPFQFLSTVLSPTLTFRAAGLTSMTSYAYEVEVVDTGGVTSPRSAPVSVTTP